MGLKDHPRPCPPEAVPRMSFVVFPGFPGQACKPQGSLYLSERIRFKFLYCICHQIILILKLIGVQLVDIPKKTGTMGPYGSIIEYYMQSPTVFKII